MGNLRYYLPLPVFGFIVSVCQTHQTITQPTFIRRMQYNISSVAYTSSLLALNTGSMKDACYLQCFVTPECMSFIYNSKSTECHTFSALLDDPPHSTNSLENSYFIQGSKFCSEMGYVFEPGIPFCYKIHHDKVNYATAVYNCENEGGRLIQIDSLAKQKVAETFVLEEVTKYRIDGERVNNNWKFSSGIKIPHLYWNVGDPSMVNYGNKITKFLSLFHKSKKWDDVLKTRPFGYICEILI